MSEQTPPQPEAKPESKPDAKPEAPEIAPVQTRHQLVLEDRTLDYQVTTGMMPLKNPQGELEANIFFVAYTLGDTPDAARPLTFVFNGGPGSSSVWLHLGALGPKRVLMHDEGWMPAPPYQLVDNAHTWLDFTDLVFIDPVGTGYSRAAKPDLNKKFWNAQGDIESVAEFIRLYLTRYQRWTSALFLAGESYGTTRAAGLAGHLIDKGIALNGIALISIILNFQTAAFDRGNDLPYLLFLPTYAATAWYHNRLPRDLQERSLRDVLDEVEKWVETQYSTALLQGDALPAAQRERITRALARYTGLSRQYIDQTNLRINIHRFCKELLRDQKRTVGRLDSRFKGFDALAATEMPEFDPSLTAITPPYTAMFNDYVRGALKYENDATYEILSFDVNRGWDRGAGRYLDTSEPLRSAFAKNPFMHVYMGLGYYDLATPYYAARYTFNHMDLEPSLRDQIHVADYEAGHMYYLDVQSLAKLKDDIAAYMQAALNTK